jgi:hypothetical protein
MKVKKFLLILFISSFLACSTSRETKEVFIFNNISFKILKNENIVDVNTLIIKEYQSFFANKKLQIPLFKCIKNKDYTMYIGIPYNTSINELINFQIMDKPVNQTEFETDSLTYFFRKKKNEGIYITEFSKVFNKNLIYILSKSNSEIVSDTLFNKTELSKRLIQK